MAKRMGCCGKPSEDELIESFRLFDKNGDGRVSADELKHVMRSLGQPLADTEVEAMIRECDTDGSGFITYAEFVKMMSL